MTDKLLIDRTLLEQALKALENASDIMDSWAQKRQDDAITALSAALAQEPEPVQEQVAWMVYTLDGKSVCVTDNPADFTDQHRVLPLYTAPPQRPRLTDEEIDSIHIHLSNTVGSSYKTLARAIERKVRGE